jgi:hypothetical protein
MTYRPRNVSQVAKKDPHKGGFIGLAIIGAIILLVVYKIATFDPDNPDNYQGAPDHYTVEQTCTCNKYVNGKYVGDYQVKVGQMCGSTRCQ